MLALALARWHTSVLYQTNRSAKVVEKNGAPDILSNGEAVEWCGWETFNVSYANNTQFIYYVHVLCALSAVELNG